MALTLDDLTDDEWTSVSGSGSSAPMTLDDLSDDEWAGLGDATPTAESIAAKTESRLKTIAAKRGDVFALPGQKLQSDFTDRPVYEDPNLGPWEKMVAKDTAGAVSLVPFANRVGARTFGGEQDLGTVGNLGRELVRSYGEMRVGGALAGRLAVPAIAGAQTALGAAQNEQQYRQQTGAEGGFFGDLAAGTGFTESARPGDTETQQWLRMASVPISAVTSFIGLKLGENLAAAAAKNAGGLTPQIAKQVAQAVLGDTSGAVADTVVQQLGQGMDPSTPEFWSQPVLSTALSSIMGYHGFKGDIQRGTMAGQADPNVQPQPEQIASLSQIDQFIDRRAPDQALENRAVVDRGIENAPPPEVEVRPLPSNKDPYPGALNPEEFAPRPQPVPGATQPALKPQEIPPIEPTESLVRPARTTEPPTPGTGENVVAGALSESGQRQAGGLVPPAEIPHVSDTPPSVKPTVSKPATVQPQVAKEPWEMTYDDYSGQNPSSDIVQDARHYEQAVESAMKNERGRKGGRWRSFEEMAKDLETKDGRTYWDIIQAGKSEKSASDIHREHVQSALASGKPVPPEVLADYPDLAAKYAKSPPAAPDAGVQARPVEAATGEAPKEVWIANKSHMYGNRVERILGRRPYGFSGMRSDKGQMRITHDEFFKLQKSGLDPRVIKGETRPRPVTEPRQELGPQSFDAEGRPVEGQELHANPFTAPKFISKAVKSVGRYAFQPETSRMERFGPIGKAAAGSLRNVVDAEKTIRGVIEPDVTVAIRQARSFAPGVKSEVYKEASKTHETGLENLLVTDMRDRFNRGNIASGNAKYDAFLKRVKSIHDKMGDFIEKNFGIVTDRGEFKKMQNYMARFSSPELQQAMGAGKGNWLHDLLVSELPKHPDNARAGVTGKTISDMFSEHSDFTRGGTQSIIKQAGSVEFTRKIPFFPDIAVDPSGRHVELFENDPVRYIKRFANHAPARLGVISVFGQTDRFGKPLADGGDSMQAVFDAFRKNLTADEAEEAALEFANAIATQHNLPLRDDQGRVLPMSGDNPITTGLENYIGTPFKTGALSTSALLNVPQTLVEGLRQGGEIGMVKAVLRTTADRARLIKIGESTGALRDDNILDMTGSGSRKIRLPDGRIVETGNKNRAPGEVFGKTIKKVGGVFQDFVNRQNDLVMVSIADDLVNRLKKGKLGEIAKNRLRYLEFTDAQINSMATGKASEAQYNAVYQRMVSMTQYSNRTRMETSRAAKNGFLNTMIPFQSYAQGAAKGLNRDWQTLVRAKTAAESGAAMVNIGRKLVGGVLAGEIATLLKGLAFGRDTDREDEGWLERIGNDFAQSFWVLPFRGLGWADSTRASFAEDVISGVAYPAGIIIEVAKAYQAIKHPESAPIEYADMNRTEIAQKLAGKFIPAARTLAGAALMGKPIAHDPKLPTSIRKFWDWKKATDPKNTPQFTTLGYNEGRRLIKRAIEQAEAGNQEKAEELIQQAIGEKAIENASKSGRPHFGKGIREVRDYIEGKLTVAELKTKERDALLEAIGKEHYDRLVQYDELLRFLRTKARRQL